MSFLLMLLAPLLGIQEQDLEHPFPPATALEVGLIQEAVDALAKEVQGWVRDEKVVGASLLLIKDRRTILSGAWGWADVKEKRPMKVDTICNIRCHVTR